MIFLACYYEFSVCGLDTLKILTCSHFYHWAFYYINKIQIKPKINQQIKLCSNDPLATTLLSSRGPFPPTGFEMHRPGNGHKIHHVPFNGPQIRSSSSSSCPVSTLTLCATRFNTLRKQSSDQGPQPTKSQTAYATSGQSWPAEHIELAKAMIRATSTPADAALMTIRATPSPSVFTSQRPFALAWCTCRKRTHPSFPTLENRSTNKHSAAPLSDHARLVFCLQKGGAIRGGDRPLLLCATVHGLGAAYRRENNERGKRGRAAQWQGPLSSKAPVGVCGER